VCRWLGPVSAWGWTGLPPPRVPVSGQVAVEATEITLKGGSWSLVVAVAWVTRFPLPLDSYPSHNGKDWGLFLGEVKRKGDRPAVRVTDGWEADIEARKTGVPQATHRLCRVPLSRSVFRRMRPIKCVDPESTKRLGKLTGIVVGGSGCRRGLAGQACPPERTQTEVSMIPGAHRINRPKLSK
jgi:hypothetical protein